MGNGTGMVWRGRDGAVVCVITMSMCHLPVLNISILQSSGEQWKFNYISASINISLVCSHELENNEIDTNYNCDSDMSLIFLCVNMRDRKNIADREHKLTYTPPLPSEICCNNFADKTCYTCNKHVLCLNIGD